MAFHLSPAVDRRGNAGRPRRGGAGPPPGEAGRRKPTGARWAAGSGGVGWVRGWSMIEMLLGGGVKSEASGRETAIFRWSR
jgi:hypothetical protein